jgi:uncharacterized membrane protein (UPF0136 family)
LQGEWELAESQLEARLRAWAIPVALGGSFLLVATGPGRFLVRVFLSMWVHEIGHATAAWLCGFPAFPGPWLTPMAQSRSLLFGLIVLLALAVAAYRAFRAERIRLCAALGVGLALHLFCTLALSVSRAKEFVIFMGDGGCLVLGSLLMLTLYAPEDSSLKRGWLRWGFLAIGAAAFADAFAQWWASRTDFDRIPFGMNEGAGLSDPSVLSENFSWSTDQIVHRYVALGCVCLAVVAVAYVRGLMRARSD